MNVIVCKEERESPKNSLNEYACSIFVYNAIRERERSGVGFSGRGDVIRCKQEKSDSLTMAMIMEKKNPWPGFFSCCFFSSFPCAYISMYCYCHAKPNHWRNYIIYRHIVYRDAYT